MKSTATAAGLFILVANTTALAASVFESRAAFELAAGPLDGSEGFEFGAGDSISPTVTVFDGVTVTTGGEPQSGAFEAIAGTGSLFVTTPTTSDPGFTTFTFDTPVTAVGFDLRLDGFVGDAVIGGPVDEVVTLTPPAGVFLPEVLFFGVIETAAPFETLTLGFTPGEVGFDRGILVDSFVFGAATSAVIPEPSSVTVVGLGLCGAAGFVRRRGR